MCEYCEYDKDEYIRALDKNSHVVLDPYKAELKVRYYGNQLNVSINYCPICGRNLKERDKAIKIKHDKEGSEGK